MNSKFLIKDGFKNFGEFSSYNIHTRDNSKLNFSGVYVFVLNKEFPRLNGKTDILYIGQSGSRNGRQIFMRIRDYYNAYKSAPQDKRIGDSLKKVKTKIRIGRTLKNNKLDNKVLIFYKKISQDKCKSKESSLLKRYSQDHIELPPLNRQQ